MDAGSGPPLVRRPTDPLACANPFPSYSLWRLAAPRSNGASRGLCGGVSAAGDNPSQLWSVGYVNQFAVRPVVQDRFRKRTAAARRTWLPLVRLILREVRGVRPALGHAEKIIFRGFSSTGFIGKDGSSILPRSKSDQPDSRESEPVMSLIEIQRSRRYRSLAVLAVLGVAGPLAAQRPVKIN